MANICVKSTMNLNQGEQPHFQLNKNNYQGVPGLLEKMRSQTTNESSLRHRNLLAKKIKGSGKVKYPLDPKG